MKRASATLARILLLVVVMFFWGAVVSCLPDDNCGGPVRYSIDGIAGIPVQFAGDSSLDTLEAEATVPYNEYALLISPVANHRAEVAPTTGHWGGRAYACDPAIVPTDQLTDVTVLSGTDFVTLDGVAVTAGDTLNAFFDIRSEQGGILESLLNYTSDLPAPAKEYQFAIALNTAPDKPQAHQFTVHYRLRSGDLYTFTSPAVTIIP